MKELIQEYKAMQAQVDSLNAQVAAKLEQLKGLQAAQATIKKALPLLWYVWLEPVYSGNVPLSHETQLTLYVVCVSDSKDNAINTARGRFDGFTLREEDRIDAFRGQSYKGFVASICEAETDWEYIEGLYQLANME